MSDEDSDIKKRASKEWVAETNSEEAATYILLVVDFESASLLPEIDQLEGEYRWVHDVVRRSWWLYESRHVTGYRRSADAAFSIPGCPDQVNLKSTNSPPLFL